MSTRATAAAATPARRAESTVPAVSVLIPTWNAAAVIKRALASVLDERGLDLECIVVDDGSTDGTAEVVREIARADPRLVLLPLPENAGVSNARNRGLEIARGRWLTLLDADDRFTPGGLGALVSAGEAGDDLAVVGQQVWSDGRRTWLGPLYDIPDIRRARRTSLAASPGLLYYVSPHGKLFRRDLVADLRFEGRVLGDQPWIIRGLLRAGDRLEVIGATVYEWIRTPPAGAGPSITTSTRGSARRGVEATRVASQALASVVTEADHSVPQARDRDVIRRAYVERLLRSDLGVHLARALRRRDPATGELLTGLDAFIAALPPDSARGPALAREIVAPCLLAWPTLAPDARAAAERLVANARAAQPDLIAAAGSGPERWALGRALAGATPTPDAAVRAVLAASALVRRGGGLRYALGSVWRRARRSRTG